MVFAALFYSYSFHWFPPGSRLDAARALLTGAIFGGLAVWLMVARIQIAPGVFIDARSAPIAIAALFEGWTAGIVATLPAVAYRAWLGGDGALAGVVGLLGVLATGGLTHAWARRDGGLGWRHAFGLGSGVFLVTLGSFAILGERGVRQFASVWLPYAGIYAIGIGVTARLFGDVAERARLASERQRFRSILDEASDAIRIVDPDRMTIVDVNRAECELSGHRREDLIGRDAREVWPLEPELRAEHEAELAEQGFARRFGLTLRTRDGVLVRVDSTRRRVAHAGRRYDIIVSREAATREAAEAARREASELRAVTLLARAAAHEINNPLAVVIGSLDLLARRLPAEAKEGELIDQAIAGGTRIRDIVARMARIMRVVAEPPTANLPPILDIRKSSEALSSQRRTDAPERREHGRE